MKLLARTFLTLSLPWTSMSCENGSPMWTRLDGRFFAVAEYSGSALSLEPMPGQKIQLSSDAPLPDKIKRFAIRRYEGASCSDRSESEGDLVSTDANQTTWLDSGLRLGTPYCYKFFIRYSSGEIFTKTLAYLGPEVISPGKIEISSLDARAIVLGLTPSKSESVDKIEVRRYKKATCADESRESGESLSPGLKDASYRDTNLALETPYCYKAFWLDTFGNFKDAVVPSPYLGKGPEVGSLEFGAFSAQSVTLAHTPSSGASYVDAKLRRYGESSCDSKSDTEGVAFDVALKIPSSVKDDSVPLLSAFCYKAFWWDAFGNVSFTTASYPGPATGALKIASLSTQTIHLAITVPTQSSYESVQLRRYQTADCSGSTQATGDSVSIEKNAAVHADGNLSFNTAYCYKIFWTDKIGNITTATASYLAGGLADGAVAIASLGDRTLNLTHTPPSSPWYSSVSLKRHTSTSCSTELESAGTAVTLNKSATTVSDSGLSLSTPYCYKAFWYDGFGNGASSAVPTPYDGLGPTGGTLSIASYEDRTIVLGHTLPTAGSYDSVELVRFESASCGTTDKAQGTVLTLDKTATSLRDSSLELSTPYCYRITWRDTFGNGPSSTVAYAGTGPLVGSISIDSLASQSINLAITPSASSLYDRVALRRYESANCTGSTADTGTGLTLAKTATSLSDSGLALSTSYCYKIFWYDAFGNASSASTSPGYTGPSDGALTITSAEPNLVTLSHTAGSRATSVSLWRYATATCAGESEASDTPLSLSLSDTTTTDNGFPSNSAFCYKATWSDAFGNKASQTASYPGPASGSFAIDRLEPNKIILSHTPPTQSSYDRVDLRRYQSSDCTSGVLENGTALTFAKSDTSYTDSGLSLSTAYCYKIFWTDQIGNVTTAVAKYSGVGPTAGSIAIDSLGPQTINLAHSPASGTNYDHVVLRRYTSLTCNSQDASQGTSVNLGKSDTTYADTGLSLGTPYCYKAFWYDAFGNFSSAHTPTSYDAQAPAAGSIAISSLAARTINLSHTPSGSANYDHVALRRYDNSSCSLEAATSGTGVTLGKDDTSASDTDLALSQAYCYKAFWYDVFGNFSSAEVASSYSGTGPTGGALSIALDSQTIILNHTPPTSIGYSAVTVREFTESSCEGKSATDGTDVPLATTTTASVSRTSLSLATPYCYKIFWYDTFGNIAATTVAYNGSGPTPGTVGISSLGSATINLSISQSADATVQSFDLRRYTSAVCEQSSKASGTSLAGITKTSTTATDTGLSLNTAYCYKGFWLDKFGNEISTTVPTPYDGTTSPGSGTIGITGRASDTIVLSHTAPTSSYYSSVSLRRHNGITSCDDKLISEGTAVAMATDATTINNTGLSSGQDYCYKIFWSDDFGNIRSAPGVSAHTPSEAFSIPPPQVTWFQNASVSQVVTLDFTPDSWVDAGAPAAKPSFLSLSSAAGTYPLTFDGTASTLGVTNWSLNFTAGSSEKNLAITTRIIDGSGNSYTTPSSLTLPDATNTSLSGSATLDSRYDGSNVTFKYLSGDVGPTDSSSSGTMSIAATDILGLSYENTPPSPVTSPYLVPTTTTYNKETRTIVAGYDLFWDYGPLDHGEYFVKTKPYLSADGSALYGPVTQTLVTVSNIAEEASQNITSGTALSNKTFADSWQDYLPAMAVGRRTDMTENIELYGFMYPAKISTFKQFFGTVTIDRRNSTNTTISSDFVNNASTRYQISADGVDASNMSIAGLAHTNGWIMAGKETHNNVAYKLVLSRRYADSSTVRLPLVEPSVSPFEAKFGALSLTPSISDNGTQRHGLAFFAESDNNNDGNTKRGIYLTKIRSDTETFDKISIFDEPNYFSANDFSSHIPSLPIDSVNALGANMVRLIHANESVGGVFYVAWKSYFLDDAYEVHGKINIARVKSSPETTNPTAPVPLISSDTIPHMYADPYSPGQLYYAMAAGQSAAGADILAVFYTNSDKPKECQLRGYTVSTGASPTLSGTNNSVTIATSTTGCLFPTLFYNASSKHFLALWIDANTKKTFYRSLVLSVTNNNLSMTPVNLAPVEVTNALEVSTNPVIYGAVCGFVASYTDSAQGELGPRIGMLRIENKGTGICGENEAVYRFDTFKPRR